MMEESTEDVKVLQASPQLQFGAVEEQEHENENNKQKEVKQFAHDTNDGERDTEEESEEEIYVNVVRYLKTT